MKTIVPLAAFPTSYIRSKITNERWQSLLNSWLLLTRNLLLAPDDVFLSSIDEACVVPFLISYVQNESIDASKPPSVRGDEALKRQTYLLLHRVLKYLPTRSEALIKPEFVARVSRAFGLSTTLKSSLESLWLQHALQSDKAYIRLKTDLIVSLENIKQASDLHQRLRDSVDLSKAIAPFCEFLLTGSDFIDSLTNAYIHVEDPQLRSDVLLLGYTCLSSLLHIQQSPSFLLDLLYDLRQRSLLQDILRKTSFYRQFEQYSLHLTSDIKRAQLLLGELAPYQRPEGLRNRKSKIDKGKGRDAGDEAFSTEHAQQLSLVSQVQDLFPELGAGFIVKVLAANDNILDQTISQLLDGNLPKHLQDSERTEELEPMAMAHDQTSLESSSPIGRPKVNKAISRKSAFENDELDKLTLDPSKLHKGRKNADMTADKLLSGQQSADSKAAIMSALAAFDSDDDERDDTYDAADVGGSIDNTVDEPASVHRNDEILFPLFKKQADLFSRNTETRRSGGRAAIREQTNMSDEAIEGWAIMLERDPKRLRQLEQEYEIGSGLQQQSLVSTAWRADTEVDDVAKDSRHASERGRGANRGRGSGRGRGTPSGPSSDHATQVARQRKDANKSSRANHNRRDQRARKIARAGGLVG